MQGEKTKRTINMRTITLFVCCVCLIGLSVSTTFLIVRATYQSQLDDKNQEALTAQKDNKVLTDQNIELRNSLQKLEDEYSKLEHGYKDLESMLHATEQKNTQTASESASDSKEILVLEPTWVSPGATTLAFDGNLRIVLQKASDKDECPKDSAAVSYLTGDTERKKLCLRTGRPEDFTYQGNNYLFNLSGIAAQAGVYRYCISISLEQ
jgi:cell division protein FtsB